MSSTLGVVPLETEYRNRRLTFHASLIILASLAIQLIMIWGFIWHSDHSIRELLFALIFFLIAGFWQFLTWLYAKARILVTSEQLILRRPDRTIKTRWNEIRRIEDVWSFWGGSRAFYVRTAHDTIIIPDMIERCDELLAIIQGRSGKRIISEWRGAKDSLREEWQGFLQKIRTHKLGVLVVVVILAAVIYATTRGNPGARQRNSGREFRGHL